MERRRQTKWKRKFTAALAACLFMMMPITAHGIEMSPDKISGDGDFVVWYRSADVDALWTAGFKAVGKSDLLEQITFVKYDMTDDFLADLEMILEHPEDTRYPDLVCIEPDYAGIFLNRQDALLSAEDLGITKTDMENMFPYTVEIGTDVQGAVREFYCTASPGAFQIRKDLAVTYLGSGDPKELQERYFCSFKKMAAAANKIYRESDGMVSLLPGYEEFYAGSAMPVNHFSWADGNEQPADDLRTVLLTAQMMWFSNEIAGDTFCAAPWGMEWMDAMSGDGIRTKAAIAYAGTPWFTRYCLTETWEENTIIVEGPEGFWWGGNGVAATAGCSDTELAADIIRTLCCDTDAMTEMAHDGEFVNNREALKMAGALGYGSCSFLCGQNQDIFQTYLPLAETISGRQLTVCDSDLKYDYLALLEQYIAQGGGVKESVKYGEEMTEVLKEVIGEQTAISATRRQ